MILWDAKNHIPKFWDIKEISSKKKVQKKNIPKNKPPQKIMGWKLVKNIEKKMQRQNYVLLVNLFQKNHLKVSNLNIFYRKYDFFIAESSIT